LLWKLHEVLGFADYPAFLDQPQLHSSPSPEYQMRRHLLKGLYLTGCLPPNLAKALNCFELYFNALSHATLISEKHEATEEIACLVARLQFRSPLRLLADAARWWRGLYRQTGQSQFETQPNWPALPGLPWRNGALQVVSLCSHSALTEEGERMAHCVADYATFCLLGNSHIVSIRDLAGNALSTAEFELTLNSIGNVFPLLISHASNDNAPPPESCSIMLVALDLKWKNPDFQTDFLELVARQKLQRNFLFGKLERNMNR
jgi:hypothetical protein